MNGEIVKALERTRERGEAAGAADTRVSLEEMIPLTISGFDLDRDEVIWVINQTGRQAEKAIRAKLEILGSPLDEDQTEQLFLSVRAATMAIFVKSFGAGLMLMEARGKNEREAV